MGTTRSRKHWCFTFFSPWTEERESGWQNTTTTRAQRMWMWRARERIRSVHPPHYKFEWNLQNGPEILVIFTKLCLKHFHLHPHLHWWSPSPNFQLLSWRLLSNLPVVVLKHFQKWVFLGNKMKWFLDKLGGSRGGHKKGWKNPSTNRRHDYKTQLFII